MRALFRFLQARRCRATAGFTLVELMVAMTGGLFLSIIVFALSRDASRFYQRESRVANATLAGLSGFERLSADVARAGHLVTANIQQDPHVCNRPATPALLATLRAIQIGDGTTARAGTELATANIAPNDIVIAGALNTPEVLITSSIAPAALGGWEITLNLSTPAASRLGLKTGATVDNSTILASIFMSGGVGHIVRLRANGMDQYAVVAGVSGNAGTALITLAAAPALQRLTNGGAQCGIDDLGKGYAVSVVDVVRYNIRPMVADGTYAQLFKVSSGLGTGGVGTAPAYEATRAELVRVELNPAGAEIATTREIVGEYAVDLRASAWAATSTTNPALVQVNAPITNTYNFTELLRGVHLRLSVRSREADRDGPIGVGGASTDIYRIGLGPTGGAPYARVRTFQSDVPLRNLEGSNW
jgi:hypothetical protein